MKILLILSTICFSLASFGYGVGQISYPLLVNSKLVSTEFTGIVSNGGGIGLQGRYTQKINKYTYFDAGAGISGGDRSNRFFLGADYEIIPDYENQPKISVKTNYENANEFGNRKHVLSFAPVVSKGLIVSEKEIYPFFSMPLSLNLDYAHNTYITSISASAGFSMKLPVEGYQHLTGSFEGAIGLNDSYSGVLISIAYPIL
jgi:hypothetical protein